jgi:hydroxymethylpyrimidine pyrophosphatase-like HAD family hydrolase
LKRLRPDLEHARIRLVFADIDGTLLGEAGSLSSRTSAALDGLRDAGVALVLCTGRSRSGAARAAETLGGADYGIVLNGAVTVDWRDGEILRRALLPRALVTPAAAIARTNKLGCVWLGTEERDDRQYAKIGDALWPRYEERNLARLRRVRSLARVRERPASLVAYGSEDGATRLAATWQAAFGGGVHAVAGPTSVYQAWYAQLTSSEANKAIAAASIAERLGINRDETLAIGDHMNDVDLLAWAGVGVCMGDGHPCARAAADYVVAEAAEDGAAMAIERFVLGTRSEFD